MAVDESYGVFTRGRDADVYIKWPNTMDHSDIDRFNSTDMHGYVSNTI